MRHLLLLAALSVAGCGTLSHAPPSERWLVPGTGRASVSMSNTPPSGRPFRIAVYGDCRGNREAHRAVVAAIREAHPDLVIFTGDAFDCFPAGHMPDLGPAGFLVPIWPQWMRGYPLFSLATLVPFPALVHEVIGSFARPVRDPDGWDGFLADTAPLRLEDRVPYLFVPGNHDLYHRFDRETAARLFGSPDAPWSEVDAAGIRFLVLDGGTDMLGDGAPLEKGAPQLSWLRDRLADAKARLLVPVVTVHTPPYSSGAEDPPDPALARDLVEAVLDPAGVFLVLNGHCHGYERVERRRPDGGTTTFLVTGGAGAPFHHEAAPGERAPGSRVFVEGRLHFVLLEAGPGGFLGRAVAVPGGDVLDAFEVRR